MKKKITSVLVLCALAFTLAMPVSAAQAAEKGIQPRVQECGNCGRMTLNTVKVRNDESGPTSTKCKHGYPYGDDLTWKVYNVYRYKCSNCSYVSTEWSAYAGTRTECHGYRLH